MKCSETLLSSDTSTILIDNWGVRLNDQKFCISRNGWINCKDTFNVALHKAVQWLKMTEYEAY